MEFIGWIHTSPNDSPVLTPEEAIQAANLFNKNNLSQPPITLSVSFVPGATTVRAFKLNPAGLEWAVNNRKTKDRSVGFEDTYGDRVPIMLAEIYQGWFMLPKGDSNLHWNLNFNSLYLNNVKDYIVAHGNPDPFFHMKYRPNHFLEMANFEVDTSENLIDVEAYYD